MFLSQGHQRSTRHRAMWAFISPNFLEMMTVIHRTSSTGVDDVTLHAACTSSMAAISWTNTHTAERRIMLQWFVMLSLKLGHHCNCKLQLEASVKKQTFQSPSNQNSLEIFCSASFISSNQHDNSDYFCLMAPSAPLHRDPGDSLEPLCRCNNVPQPRSFRLPVLMSDFKLIQQTWEFSELTEANRFMCSLSFLITC